MASVLRCRIRCMTATIYSTSLDASRSGLVPKVDSLQSALHPSAERSVVSVLDLFDKLLWSANGNPIRVGLASPPSGADGVAEPEH